ncbi:hypothetical protein JTB14_022213 [Gonioctena quinquepunctata]|nr:hypothetical protein JTB14_022213 [Gonioctena quinquepunctata]
MSSVGRRLSVDSAPSDGLVAENPPALISEEITMAFSTARTKMTALISSSEDTQNKKESLINTMEAMTVAFDEVTELNCQIKVRQDCFEEIGKKLNLIVLESGGGENSAQNSGIIQNSSPTRARPGSTGSLPLLGECSGVRTRNQ